MLQGSARYVLQIDGLDLSVDDLGDKLSKNKSKEAVPVLQAYKKDKLVTEIGINVRHTRSLQPYFTSLAGNSEDYLSGSEINYFLSCLSGIVLRDDSLSTLDLASASQFIVHTADKTLQGILGKESELFFLREISRRFEEGIFDLEEALKLISKDPSLYEHMLSSQENYQREIYHNLMKGSAQQMDQAHKDASSIRKGAKELEKIEAELRGKVDTTDVQAAIKNLKSKARQAYKPISQDLLAETYEKVKGREKLTPEMSKFDAYSSISQMKTTLHKRTHQDYSPEIKSFRLVEAKKRSTDMRKIIIAANRIALEREVIPLT